MTGPGDGYAELRRGDRRSDASARSGEVRILCPRSATASAQSLRLRVVSAVGRSGSRPPRRRKSSHGRDWEFWRAVEADGPGQPSAPRNGVEESAGS